jgi:CO dehydrogenase/acetyl-CoA synthase alpha subunit
VGAVTATTGTAKPLRHMRQMLRTLEQQVTREVRAKRISNETVDHTWHPVTAVMMGLLTPLCDEIADLSRENRRRRR